MTDPPLVSVLIPAYNHARYLGVALGDALGQTHRNLEVLVGDDASSDATPGVVAAVTDRRLVYSRRERNVGAAGNVRSLLDDARGRYVAILNDDDRWATDLVARLVAPMESDATVVAAFCLYDIIDDAGRLLPADTDVSHVVSGLSTLAPGRHQPFLTQAVRKAMPANLCTLFRRSLVPPADLPHDVGAAYDWWISYLACRGGGAVFFVDARMASFRRHGLSTTSIGGLRISSGEAAVYRRLLRDPRLGPLHPEMRRAYSAVLIQLSIDQRIEGLHAEARRTAIASVLAHPTPGGLRAVARTARVRS